MQLDAEARALFMAVAHERRHARGAMLLRESDPGRDVFLMLAGRADVLVHSPDGRMVIYTQIGPGDLVGVLAAIDGGVRSASVVARTAGRTACLGPEGFQRLMQHPAFVRAMQRYFVARIRSLTERVYECSALLVRERLGRELIRMARDSGPGDGPHRLDPAPGHLELAARIGTHREAVSREMSRLARLGVLRRQGRAVLVCSCAELAATLELTGSP